MYDEDELLPIAALQHLAFCPRQWGLMYLEGLWAENLLTVDGGHFHERVDLVETEARHDVRIARALRLRSLRLGLSGRADVVEFHRKPETDLHSGADNVQTAGVVLEGVVGLWQPVPVEYKRGRPKPGICDEVQLCAQALCLEEMLGIDVSSGVLFYGKPRRRHEVRLDRSLRDATENLVARLHELTAIGQTPPARRDKRCRSCSLVDLCLPAVTGGDKSARDYLAHALMDTAEDPE